MAFMKVDPRAFRGLSRFLAPAAGGPLADRALAEGRITPAQLEECIREQDRTGRPLDELLIERGYLTAEDAARLRQPALPPEAARAAEDPARLVGHYVLTEVLGAGGMAEVWKAWDRSLGRWVAVKFLKDHVGHQTQRLEREGRMAGRLSHPGIISIFERGRHGDRAYLVMPYVEGAPPRPPLAPREAARLAWEVAQALAYAHAHGVIHRDVKPANILVEKSGRAVLADFGLAIAGGSGASLWAVSGTPEYASPEQVRGEALDVRTDVYSLGATLYHLLAGRPPFSGRDAEEIGRKVLEARPAPLRGVPARLRRIVERAMERDRARRYPGMAEMAEDLRRYLEGTERSRLTWKAWVAVAAAGILPWAVAGVVIWQGRAETREAEVRSTLEEARGELARVEALLASAAGADADRLRSAAYSAAALFRYAAKIAGGELPEASAGIGRCYELTGQEALAEEEYRKAEQDVPEGRIGLARIWLRRHLEGRRELDWLGMARGRLEGARPAKGDPAEALLLYASGRKEEALRAGAAALAKASGDDLLLLVLGAAACDLGRWEEAAARLGRAVELRPGQATLWYYKGVALAGKGDRAGAREAFAHALKAAPPGWLLLAEAERRLAELGG
jgi:tetratricopeptide (TPR) repeat protein